MSVPFSTTPDQSLVGKFLPRPPRHIDGGRIGAHHHQHTVTGLGQNAGIRNRHGGRRIDDDPIKQRLDTLQQKLQTAVGHQFRGIGDLDDRWE